MGKKKLQGADGINFQMQLTIKGLETVTFPKETLTNESGKDIAWIECLGGKVSAYVNLPHAVRPNNIQPFQLSDCIQIDLISDKVIEYMKAYLKKHMKGNYSNEILKQLNVSSMECNITIMSQMPKVMNSNHANRITKVLTDSINSGVIGSKAVLELLKYPAYADMVSAKIRERAFEGSKSSAEQAFDRLKESELKEAEQGLASVYMQGFHLRNVEKQVNAFKKPSAWNPDEQTA